MTADSRRLKAADGESVRSAVLVPVFRDPRGELRVVVMVRAPGGRHGGQLGFPGGKREADDPSLLETAIRESFEEVGLTREYIKHLETLPEARTQSTGFHIQPFLAFIERPASWIPSAAEVADILEPSVSWLLDPANEYVVFETDGHTGEERRIDYFEVSGHRLWGASYRILKPLLPRLVEGDVPV